MSLFPNLSVIQPFDGITDEEHNPLNQNQMIWITLLLFLKSSDSRSVCAFTSFLLRQFLNSSTSSFSKFCFGCMYAWPLLVKCFWTLGLSQTTVIFRITCLHEHSCFQAPTPRDNSKLWRWWSLESSLRLELGFWKLSEAIVFRKSIAANIRNPVVKTR